LTSEVIVKSDIYQTIIASPAIGMDGTADAGLVSNDGVAREALEVLGTMLV